MADIYEFQMLNNQLEECRLALDRLSKQINENERLFATAFSESIQKFYRQESEQAKKACSELGEQINKLQAEVVVRMTAAGML